MYLKVPYHKDENGTHNATIEQVQDAIANEMDGLTVDDDLHYPSVEFPDGATYADYQRVQRVLIERGFEAY